jgi:hypothetical protein
MRVSIGASNEGKEEEAAEAASFLRLIRINDGLPAHVRNKRLWYFHAAVALLIILKNSHKCTTHS